MNIISSSSRRFLLHLVIVVTITTAVLLHSTNAVEATSAISSSSSSSSFASSNSDVPSIIIGTDVHGNSVELPLVGTGTWQYNDTIAYQSVCKAFQAGYTFVDTALGYGNQKGVGKAIRDCWQGTREDLFVMTKIPGGLSHDKALAAHKQNMLELDLTYVDHLMTHFPSDWDETVASPQARQEEWLTLESIYKSGQARSIGVSHYCTQHLKDIMKVATVPISINQVEFHIGSQDVDHVIDFCHDSNITFMSFSPLCGPCTYEPEDSLINGKVVKELGDFYQVSGSQISLRYITQQGIPVIPKSNNMDHIRSNLDIFGFSLTDEDMWKLWGVEKPKAEGGDCDVP